MQRALNTDRYFDTLPPKRIRDAQRLSKWADEAINVFFKEGKHAEELRRAEADRRQAVL